MSLLMDALKKAEQDKKRAAQRLEENGQAGTERRPLSLDTTDNGSAPATAADEADTGGETPGAITQELELDYDAPAAGDDDAAGHGAGMSLVEFDENLNRTLDGSRESREAVRSGMADGSSTLAMELADAASGEAATQPADRLDQTFHGLDLDLSQAQGGASPTASADSPRQPGTEERVYDETLPGVPAAQLVRDIGQDQPTPVAAETVFAAGRTRSGASSGLKWTLLGLTLVMLLAAGIWYYFTVTPLTRDLPSPLVARGIEAVRLPETEAAPGAEAGTAMGPALPPTTTGNDIEGTVTVTAEDGAVATLTVAGDETAGAPAGSPPPAEADVAAADVEPDASAAGAEPAAAKPATPPAGQSEPPVTAADTSPPARPAVLPVTTPPSLVQVGRHKGLSSTGRMVREAWRLYQAGDYGGAGTLYTAAREQEPDNVDALLGLGAIALRQGDLARAVELHARVLRLDPRNRTANAVFISLQRKTDLVGSESALKSMLEDMPDHPYLYFTLGNVYATQQRWAEAQQAFFDAYRNDTENADYAYNLAVALDRIGQRQAAQDYYNTAVRLAANWPASFDQQQALERARALSAPEPGEP